MENNLENNTFDASFFPESISLDSDFLQDMHIILNDSDCSDTFFNDVCSYLSDYGLQFDITHNCIDINEDDYTIITLDQQYNSGFGSLIFAPFDNSRLGDSDSLALAFKAAMEEEKIVVDDILSGKVGFRKDEDGHVSTFVPTESEEKIEFDKSTSFVTISLGTQNPSVEMVAESILSGLIRQKYYLENFDSQTDLLYRADAGESVSVVAEYFGAEVKDLVETNELKDMETLEAQTIINPSVQKIVAFDANVSFKQEEKGKNY